MSDWITIEQAKAHLRMTADDYVEIIDMKEKLAGAMQITSDFLNRPVPWKNEDGEEQPVPPSVVSATLLILGTLDSDRTSDREILSSAVRALLWPHRNVAV